MRIVIDPGHGYKKGNPTGARALSLVEDTVIFSDDPQFLGMTQRLGNLLRAAGHETVYTRVNDNFVALSERVRLAKLADADLFISLHCNAAGSQSARGFEVFAAKGDARSLHVARIIENSVRLYNGTQFPSRGVKWDNEGAHRSLYVLQKLKGVMPAVLLECGFLTNPQDAKLLGNRHFRQSLANGIAQAVIRYAK
jgi:N-acetylmuramoyl-L-alanine amidase